MTVRKAITLLCFNIIALTASAQQQRHIEDSTKANNLIIDKLKSLEGTGVQKFLYLYSDAGTIAIMYEKDGKIKGVKSYYKGKRGSRFKSLNLSKEDKSNFETCMAIASKDTIVSFSNCKDFVHSYNRIVFKAVENKHSLKGNFTSDCAEALEKNSMLVLFNIYKRFLVY